MTIATTGNNNCNIFFADSDVDGASEYAGYIQYSHASDELRLGASATTRFEVRQNEVEVVDVDLVIGTSGHGIQFDVNGSGSDQLLDDYEEGPWTPTVQGTTTAGTATYAAQSGKYTKIGNKVFWECYVSWSSGTGAGNLYVYGLPFTNGGSTYSACTIGYIHNFTLRSGHTPTGLTGSNATFLYFYEVPSGGGTNQQLVYDSEASMILSGHYQIQ